MSSVNAMMKTRLFSDGKSYLEAIFAHFDRHNTKECTHIPDLPSKNWQKPRPKPNGFICYRIISTFQ
jgi:hypothetical protein